MFEFYAKGGLLPAKVIVAQVKCRGVPHGHAK